MERALNKLARTLFLASMRDRVVRMAVPALVLGALWILGTRRLAPDRAAYDAWVLGGLGAAAVALAALGAFRARLRRPDLLAWADRRAGAGGLLVTLDAHPDERWRPLVEERLARIEPPRARFTERSRLFLPAAIFFLAALVVPVAAEARRPPSEPGERFAEALVRRLERIESEALAPPEEVEALKREIERVRRDLAREGLGPRQWEALDALRRRMDRGLDDRARQLARGAAAAAALGSKGAGRGDDAAAAREMAEAFSGLGASLPSDLFGDPELARRLAEGAGSRFAEELLGRDPEALQAALDALRGWLAENAEALAACECSGEGLGSLREHLATRPGRGGATRGRADARLDLAGETPRQQAKFLLERIRPRNAPRDPGELLAVGVAPPDETPDENAARGVDREFDAAGQELVGKNRVRPRHRGVVRRFFGETPATRDDEEDR
ncbi:MAG: hypothetical protein R3F20_13140 [Planctomycetota bacterium]